MCFLHTKNTTLFLIKTTAYTIKNVCAFEVMGVYYFWNTPPVRGIDSCGLNVLEMRWICCMWMSSRASFSAENWAFALEKEDCLPGIAQKLWDKGWVLPTNAIDVRKVLLRTKVYSCPKLHVHLLNCQEKTDC